jgi:hypothetical protein
MIPLILTAIGAYLIGDSQRDNQTFAEGGEVDKIVELDFYSVTLSTPDHDRSGYVGTDMEEAIEEMNAACYEDFYNERGGDAILQKATNRYRFIGNLDEDETIQDYPIEDYHKDKSVYEKIEEGDWEDVDFVTVTAPPTEEENIKEAGRDLRDEITAYCKNICSDYKMAAFMGSTFYGLKSYKDGNIIVRVSDHYPNPSNIRLGKGVVWEENQSFNTGIPNVTKNIYGFLSVVIRDENPLNRRQSDFLSGIRERQEDTKYKMVKFFKYSPDEYYGEDSYIDFQSDIDGVISDIEKEIDKALEANAYEDDDITLFKEGGTIDNTGNHSNLTPDQYKAANTEAFKEWFGESKVIDENGDPLVCYHGTKERFSRFSTRYSAQGVLWFTSDKNKILAGESGAASSKEIIEVFIKADKIAGWAEYEKYGLGQIENMGYSAIKLDDDYVVFEPKNVKIIPQKQQRKKYN